MKYLLSIVLLSAVSFSVVASETAGLCEDAAVVKALKTAPGRDPSSPASLLEIKLMKTEAVDNKNSVETYYVQTEDQGGTAASLISVKVTKSSSPLDEVLRVKCRVVNQEWVE